MTTEKYPGLPKNIQVSLEILKMEPLFSYLDAGNGYTATQCLLVKNSEVVSGGVSLCSPLDQFEKYKGRTVAAGRAIKAALRQESSMPILFCDSSETLYKSTYLPKLSSWEKELVERHNKYAKEHI